MFQCDIRRVELWRVIIDYSHDSTAAAAASARRRFNSCRPSDGKMPVQQPSCESSPPPPVIGIEPFLFALKVMIGCVRACECICVSACELLGQQRLFQSRVSCSPVSSWDKKSCSHCVVTLGMSFYFAMIRMVSVASLSLLTSARTSADNTIHANVMRIALALPVPCNACSTRSPPPNCFVLHAHIAIYHRSKFFQDLIIKCADITLTTRKWSQSSKIIATCPLALSIADVPK